MEGQLGDSVWQSAKYCFTFGHAPKRWLRSTARPASMKRVTQCGLRDDISIGKSIFRSEKAVTYNLCSGELQNVSLSVTSTPFLTKTELNTYFILLLPCIFCSRQSLQNMCQSQADGRLWWFSGVLWLAIRILYCISWSILLINKKNKMAINTVQTLRFALLL